MPVIDYLAFVCLHRKAGGRKPLLELTSHRFHLITVPGKQDYVVGKDEAGNGALYITLRVRRGYPQ
eukprot:7037672-Alexandrium_andersonii.AAC.1